MIDDSLQEIRIERYAIEIETHEKFVKSIWRK